MLYCFRAERCSLFHGIKVYVQIRSVFQPCAGFRGIMLTNVGLDTKLLRNQELFHFIMK